MSLDVYNYNWDHRTPPRTLDRMWSNPIPTAIQRRASIAVCPSLSFRLSL